jgi:hypothetical protein
MTKVLCPANGQECFMALWTSDHLLGQFYVPQERRQSLCDFVVAKVMQCVGDPEACQPGEPASIDLAVAEFKESIKEQ